MYRTVCKCHIYLSAVDNLAGITNDIESRKREANLIQPPTFDINDENDEKSKIDDFVVLNEEGKLLLN